MSIVLEIELPEYKHGDKPDSSAIGAKLDELLRRNFAGKDVVVRCVGLRDHPNLSLDRLAAKVLATGTDKYDDNQQALASHLIPVEQKDSFYGEEVEVDKSSDKMSSVIDDFYHGAVADRGYSVRIDLIMVYDRTQLTMLENIYPRHTNSDVFVFNDQKNKISALLGLIKIK